jgi:3-deoxy-D-manno-octulosonate 8-phosphate phosphatase (KDO 8-P phosphatase)
MGSTILSVEIIRKLGIKQLILSTEINPVVKVIAEKLKVPVIHEVTDKANILSHHPKEHNLK